MFIFNTVELDKVYTDDDITRLVPPRQYGIDTDFYGGRCYMIGETKTDVLLIIENKGGLKVIDTAAVKLDNIHIKHIRELAKKRKLKFDAKTTKDELINLLGER